MPKARHRKRVRTARLDATAAPLATGSTATEPDANGASSSTTTAAAGTKKVGKKEAEVTNLLDKLRSDNVDERIWASSALSNLLTTLPAVTLRLLLSKNLIGLLIERLTDSDDNVVVECLGALRNLAVSSPPSIVSEMHNKRLLLPLLTHHLPLLLPLLPTMLGPAPEPIKPTLPAGPEHRAEVDLANAKAEQRRRLYWDWCENVFMLLWCLAESTTKILASLNASKEKVVEFALAYLEARAVGLEAGDEAGAVAPGMEVDGKKKKGKKGEAASKNNNERVPLFVVVAAAQTLHAFTSTNSVVHFTVLSHPTLPSLSTLLATPTPPTTKVSRTDAHAASNATTDGEDWLQLRVLCFGILLELVKAGAGTEKEQLRLALKEQQSVLLELVSTELENVAQASVATAKEMDPSANVPGAAPTAQGNKLTSIERQLSTLQLSLEVLSEWCATLDAEGLGQLASAGDDDSEEEWGGIAGAEDVEMGEDEEDDQEEVDNAEGIIRKTRDDDEDAMDAEEDEAEPKLVLSDASLSLFADLPLRLLALAQPTSMSFIPAAPDTATTSISAAAPSTLLPSAPGAVPTPTTSTATLADVPEPLHGILDILTTVHVRAIECLNNVYITLARSAPGTATGKEGVLQKVWEGVMGLVQGASETGKSAEEDEKKMEVVMAGTGVAWGVARVGLGSSSSGGGEDESDDGAETAPKLIIGPSTTPFLISLFSHPFAVAPTPAGEAIRVRIAGCLGWIGRREGILAAENAQIGHHLLSLLPPSKTEQSPFNPTPEVLLQAVDSFIDLYADEESSYDKEVFRNGRLLPRLEGAVQGVRAATKKIDRKKFPELRSRADGALENLAAFVEYRRGIR